MESNKVTVNFKSGKSKTYKIPNSDMEDILVAIKEVDVNPSLLFFEDDVIRFETVEFIEFFVLWLTWRNTLYY